MNFDNGESMAPTVPVLDMQMSGMNMGDMEMGARPWRRGHGCRRDGRARPRRNDRCRPHGHDGMLKDAAPGGQGGDHGAAAQAILKANDSLMAGTLDLTLPPRSPASSIRSAPQRGPRPSGALRRSANHGN